MRRLFSELGFLLSCRHRRWPIASYPSTDETDANVIVLDNAIIDRFWRHDDPTGVSRLTDMTFIASCGFDTASQPFRIHPPFPCRRPPRSACREYWLSQSEIVSRASERISPIYGTNRLKTLYSEYSDPRVLISETLKNRLIKSSIGNKKISVDWICEM